MYRRNAARAASLIVLGAIASFAFGQSRQTKVVFMEPTGESSRTDTPTYTRVSDAGRIKTYNEWLDNESARRALDLYERAWAAMGRRGYKGDVPAYHIALVPNGNHVAAGFKLEDESGVKDLSTTFYIKLGPDRWRFSSTMLHETGHILLATLNNNDGIPAEAMASIPHTTAALSDRGTAFNEGFAIHLETLAAHLSTDDKVRDKYRHESFRFGPDQKRSAEYYRHASDLGSYAQTVSRYYDVRENNFAFASTMREPDYLRVQLEKSRDFATLRNPNQLLQSEGFYASFFFSWTMRGSGKPDAKTIAARYDETFDVLAEMFASNPRKPDAPFLLQFVETYMSKMPQRATEIVDALLDLSHGVFVDADAAEIWREHYLSAVRLDIQKLRNPAPDAKRGQWRQAVLKDPKTLYSRLGPQIGCEVPDQSVLLVAFGKPQPLYFDVNTVQEGIMRMIPGITGDELSAWLSERERKPFVDVDDFKKRAGLNEVCLEHLKF